MLNHLFHPLFHWPTSHWTYFLRPCHAYSFWAFSCLTFHFLALLSLHWSCLPYSGGLLPTQPFLSLPHLIIPCHAEPSLALPNRHLCVLPLPFLPLHSMALLTHLPPSLPEPLFPGLLLSVLGKTAAAGCSGLAEEGRTPSLAQNFPKCRASQSWKHHCSQINFLHQDKKISLIFPIQVQALIWTRLKGQYKLPSTNKFFHSHRVQLLTWKHAAKMLARKSTTLSKHSRVPHYTSSLPRAR